MGDCNIESMSRMYDRAYVDELHEKMEEIISQNDKNIAFDLITKELENCENRYLTELMGPLNYLQYEPVLNWIEVNADRPNSVSQSWGHLAASSKFNWERAKKWLKMGRPWSLIALDALMFCTTKDERLNQSAWMREINPILPEDTNQVELARALRLYLEQDKVPRTKGIINKIIHNIFESE